MSFTLYSAPFLKGTHVLKTIGTFSQATKVLKLRIFEQAMRGEYTLYRRIQEASPYNKGVFVKKPSHICTTKYTTLGALNLVLSS